MGGDECWADGPLVYSADRGLHRLPAQDHFIHRCSPLLGEPGSVVLIAGLTAPARPRSRLTCRSARLVRVQVLFWLALEAPCSGFLRAPNECRQLPEQPTKRGLSVVDFED